MLGEALEEVARGMAAQGAVGEAGRGVIMVSWPPWQKPAGERFQVSSQDAVLVGEVEMSALRALGGLSPTPCTVTGRPS